MHSIEAISWNLADPLHLVQSLMARGVTIEFLKERLVFTGEEVPVAMSTLSVVATVVGFERTLIREWQGEVSALPRTIEALLRTPSISTS